MKNFQFFFLLLTSPLAYSQETSASISCDSLRGKWAMSVNFKNKIDKYWFFISDNCEVKQVPLIKNPGMTYPKKRWTNIDLNGMRIYGQYYMTWENKWSDEIEFYQIVSISTSEIKLKCIAETEAYVPDQPEFIYFRLKKVE